MNLFHIRRFFLLPALFLCSITVSFSQDVQVNYNYYKISKDNRVDSSYIRMLMPYKDSLNKQMNIVLGFATNTMYKTQPECALGNLLADCVKTMAAKKYNRKVDIGMVNFGGIRSYISKGEVTVGKIFELMPFDNLLILQELRGDTLQSLLNRVAEKGGWPVSGLTMQIKDNKALNIFIDGKPLDPNAIYIVANSDYVANGGDDCNMLKGIPQISAGYIIRDVIIEYISNINAQGLPVDAKTEKRITYAN